MELEDRRDKMQKLEGIIENIQTMFTALAGIVAETGQKLDQIEENVQNTKNYVEAGEQKLESAEEYVRKRRKLKAFTYIAVLLGIAGVVLWILHEKGHLKL